MLVAGCGPALGPARGDGIATTTGATGGSSGGEWDSGVCGQAEDGSFRLSCDVGAPDPEPEGPPKIDVLIVIDDGPSMATEMPWLGPNLLRLASGVEELLDPALNRDDVDVQAMVVSAAAAHPMCAGAEVKPATESCLSRPFDFRDPQLCARSCDLDVELPRPFIRIGQPNLETPVPPTDVDGDGEPESEAARLLACVGQIGDTGCEYGSPLEAMVRALDPAAEWNLGPEPFLREDSALAIVLIGDTPDCSVADPELATSSPYMNVDPQTQQPAPSPAMCWNAGVQCEFNPDETLECLPSPSPLHPIVRYRDYLTSFLDDDRAVSLSVVGGFPPVLEHNEQAPYQAVSGGFFDVVHQNWRDPAAPEGDILPEHWEMGIDAVASQFWFGIGPGCTEVDDDLQGRQGLPPLRQTELCRAVERYDDWSRCCHESICDDDWSAIGACAVASAGHFGPVFWPVPE